MLDGGKDCEQNEEGYAASNRQQAIGLHFAISAPKDVVPPPPRDLQRMAGVAAAATFAGSTQLYVKRLFGALWLAEGPFFPSQPPPYQPLLAGSPPAR